MYMPIAMPLLRSNARNQLLSRQCRAIRVLAPKLLQLLQGQS